MWAFFAYNVTVAVLSLWLFCHCGRFVMWLFCHCGRFVVLPFCHVAVLNVAVLYPLQLTDYVFRVEHGGR